MPRSTEASSLREARTLPESKTPSTPTPRVTTISPSSQGWSWTSFSTSHCRSATDASRNRPGWSPGVKRNRSRVTTGCSSKPSSWRARSTTTQ